MKKILTVFLTFFFLFLIAVVVALTTIGIETKRFNNIISKKISQSKESLNLSFDTIKFKLDIKQLSLFLETAYPKLNYRNINVPVEKIKVYIDFSSVLSTSVKIDKVSIVLKELNIKDLKNISNVIKPSNFKNLIVNKLKNGKLSTEIEFYLDQNNKLKNFIAKGKVIDLKSEISNNLFFEKAKFEFFADNSDILIKNIFGELDGISIKDGDLKIILSPEISIRSNFVSSIKFKNILKKSYFNLPKKFKYIDAITDIDTDLRSNFTLNLDKTYKMKNYNFSTKGKVKKVKIKLKNLSSNIVNMTNIDLVLVKDSELKLDLANKKRSINLTGKYTLDNKKYLEYNIKNNYNTKSSQLDLNLQFDKRVDLQLINYFKKDGIIANLSLNLELQKERLKINHVKFIEGDTQINAENVLFDKNKIINLKNLSIKTYNNSKLNNDFSLSLGKKIKIKGSQFDATNLPKILNKRDRKNSFSKMSKNIDIEFGSIIAPLSEKLSDFKLIGFIDKGKFTKISAKGDFGNNNFLDISMKDDQKSNKKYLEIYSDLPKPLLTEFNFFKGLQGGKLLYSSIIDEKNTTSKLKIENFKVINAPGLVKLLSLADLNVLKVLAEGEGLRFTVLEISMSKSDGFIKINEILATGPSMSVLMEGYKDKNEITSLRGTLVPAKNLNKWISKIPVIGDIVIPKEAGEGLFGISFKMKGPPGKIKTTINPIRTITPRFIQKILEKNKNSK